MSSAGKKRKTSPTKRSQRAEPPDRTEELPAVQLVSSVVFPNDVVSIQLAENDPILALLEQSDDDPIVATVYTRGDIENPEGMDDLHRICVLCRIVQHMQVPGGAVQAVFQGLQRAELLDFSRRGDVIYVTTKPVEDEPAPQCDRRLIDILDLVGEYVPRDGSYPDDLEGVLRLNIRGPGKFADLVAAYLHLPLAVKRDVAVSADVEVRLELLALSLEEELRRCSIESDVHEIVRDQIEERQREQYLRQQLKAIRTELGEEASGETEYEQLRERLENARMPKAAREVTEREIKRLRSVSTSSAEYQVIRTYAGWLLDLPWSKRSKDKLAPKRAKEILDKNHSGLEKVKERILEHLAVCKLKKSMGGSILCLVGPPGVGKTTLGRAIAESLGRKLVRMTVGGLRDEAEIKGHRRTYVGAMPGKVIQLMKNAGTKNPVFQIDEIDKMGSDARGDPSAAVLEVLDPECNGEFSDHYLDIGFDLSEVFFLVTANLLDTIPPALRDRLEIVRIGGYTRSEKLTIARTHLVQRALEKTGLKKGHVRFTPAGLARIVDGHTREAGLRELERNLIAVCRKVATRYVAGDTKPVSVGQRRLREFLGPARYKPDLAGRRPEVGVATGMAWTAYGGALLTIEANRMPGKGDIQVTGRLGDVMQESAKAALSYIRANCEEFDISPEVFRTSDIHIHFPEGATPKDGPSAGVAVATCLASLFTGRAVRHDVAMTGEITLKGRVLEVGGIKEKLLAAHRAGIKRVIIPQDNIKDLEDLPDEVRKAFEVICSEDVMTNICESLLHIVVPANGVLHDVDTDPAVQIPRESRARKTE